VRFKLVDGGGGGGGAMAWRWAVLRLVAVLAPWVPGIGIRATDRTRPRRHGARQRRCALIAIGVACCGWRIGGCGTRSAPSGWTTCPIRVLRPAARPLLGDHL